MIINKDLVIEDKAYSFGWLCDTVDKLKPVELYTGAAKSTNFQLADSAANYNMLLIEYQDTGGQFYSKWVVYPYNKGVDLLALDSDAGTFYFKTVQININGKNVSFGTQRELYWVGNDKICHEGGPWIYINNVWGYNVPIVRP